MLTNSMEFARAFRRAVPLVAADLTRETSMMTSLKTFPRGCCGVASELLAKLLVSQFDVSDSLLIAVNRRRPAPGMPPWETHAWIELHGFIVDVTIDQFFRFSEGCVIRLP